MIWSCVDLYCCVVGVAGLTLIEIKDDLKELIPQSDDNDTDSDCSLLSEDILDSVYPVAPRSAPRSAGNSSLPDYASAGSSNVSNDEAIYLINDISKTHKELYENEKYREEMEIQCEVRTYYLFLISFISMYDSYCDEHYSLPYCCRLMMQI